MPAPAVMGAQVDVPALSAQNVQIAACGFAAGQDHKIGVARNGLACTQHCQAYTRFLRKRVHVVKIGHAAEAKTDDVQAVAFAFADIERVFGRQPPCVREPWDRAKPWPAGAVFDQAKPIVEQRGIAPEFVDEKPFDLLRVGGVDNCLCADDLGDDAAPVDVTGQNDGHIGGGGKAHIGNVAGAKINLGRGAGTFDDHQIMGGFQAFETIQHMAHQLGFQFGIVAGFDSGQAFALNDNLRAGFSFGFQQNRVHVGVRRKTCGQRLKRLCATDFALIHRNGGVV